MRITSIAKDITLDSRTGIVTLQDAGVYKVEYGVFAINNEFTDTVSLYLNGHEISGSRRSLENNAMTEAIMLFQTSSAGSTLNIQIISERPVRFYDEAGGITGYLTITQLN